jgi:hypothetical protein
MALMKRATKKLASHGLQNLEVHSGLYGYSVREKSAKTQRAKVHKTVNAAVDSAIAGERPEITDDV